MLSNAGEASSAVAYSTEGRRHLSPKGVSGSGSMNPGEHIHVLYEETTARSQQGSSRSRYACIVQRCTSTLPTVCGETRVLSHAAIISTPRRAASMGGLPTHVLNRNYRPVPARLIKIEVRMVSYEEGSCEFILFSIRYRCPNVNVHVSLLRLLVEEGVFWWGLHETQEEHPRNRC